MALTKPNPRWPHGENIGNSDCPFIRRWTLLGFRPDIVCPECKGHGEPLGDGSGWDGTSFHRPACTYCGGDSTCPDPRPAGFKLFLHRFSRKADDRDMHNHPCAFFTFCFFGGYEDMVPCPKCKGTTVETKGHAAYALELGKQLRSGGQFVASTQRTIRAYQTSPCTRCTGSGEVVGDRLRIGSFRYRPASHTHCTRSSKRWGAWTLVLMLPKSQTWGFYRDGKWWGAEAYEDEFGPAMRCD